MDPRKRIEDELRAIDRELRVDLPKEILRAREHGDLSETPSTRPPRSASTIWKTSGPSSRRGLPPSP